MNKRVLVLGSSGVLGIAWTVGALAALEAELGWDARDADLVIGTSGGAFLGALLLSGVSVDDLFQAQLSEAATQPPQEPAAALAYLMQHQHMRPRLPRPIVGSVPLLLRGLASPSAWLTGLLPRGRSSAEHLQRLIDRPGAVHAGELWTVAMDYRTGERVTFGAPGHPNPSRGRAVEASTALPGWFAPVQVEGRPYVDAALRWPCSADLAAAAHASEVYVIAPLAAVDFDSWSPRIAVDRGCRRVVSWGVRRDIATLTRAGIATRLIAPNAEGLTHLGANMMDGRARRTVSRSAYDGTRRAFAA